MFRAFIWKCNTTTVFLSFPQKCYIYFASNNKLDVHLIIKVPHCNLRDWINHNFNSLREVKCHEDYIVHSTIYNSVQINTLIESLYHSLHFNYSHLLHICNSIFSIHHVIIISFSKITGLRTISMKTLGCRKQKCIKWSEGLIERDLSPFPVWIRSDKCSYLRILTPMSMFKLFLIKVIHKS